MRFQVLDIIPHQADPVTGAQVDTATRFAQVLETAVRAEELGFDSFSVGERHAGEFISSSPAVVLGAIAAQTRRIKLHTGVVVLSILDPVRVAEDFATVDQLSGGRLELGIGKGNEVLQYPLFGRDLDDQWDLLEENYQLLSRLLTEDEVSFSGRFRADLHQVRTTPRPFQPGIRIWHGSATSLRSAELAARYGDPLFTANAIQPRENYLRLINHYKEHYEQAGHDPARRYIGSGSGAGGVYLADSTAQAIKQFGPVYEGLTARRDVPGNNTPYRSIEHAVAEGPLLVGSPEDVAAKIIDYHTSYGHDLQSISLPTTLPFAGQLETLERFATQVIPLISTPTTLWSEHDQQPRANRVHAPLKEHAA
ncbi:LLM class flavin-dependent oxidoreductase [Glutamicibacter sp. NPDC087344]|uniref:LLM class flavin-dependent oxidoreductase n=1 Tax=Glutamicibacter sp. NPDC087344 TaxID=3363994 RepID=UPI0038105ADE